VRRRRERAGERLAVVLEPVRAVDEDEREPGEVGRLGAVVPELDEAVGVRPDLVVVDLVEHDRAAGGRWRRRRATLLATQHDRTVDLRLDGDRAGAPARARAADAREILDLLDLTGRPGRPCRPGRADRADRAFGTYRACGAGRSSDVPRHRLLGPFARLALGRDEQVTGLVAARGDHALGDGGVERRDRAADGDRERDEGERGQPCGLPPEP
jgi:hypothetical protein